MPRHLLTVKKIESLLRPGTKPGRYSDGGGLFLSVDKGNGRSWIFRIMQRGERSDIGLGSASFITLAEARDLAFEIKSHAKRGGDVKMYIQKRKDTGGGDMSVKRAARQHFQEHSKDLATRTRKMWGAQLEQYVYPVIGYMLIKDVTPREIKRVLEPIWTRIPDTAHRVRMRLRQLFNWARTEGHYSEANPVLGVEKGLPDNSRETKHHDALPWKELPAFMKELASHDGMSARCLELLILCGSRSIEARGAKWDEFDFEAKTWTVPAERMKGPIDRRKPHRVALSSAAIDLVKSLPRLHPELLFPSPRGKVLSDMAFKSLYSDMDQNQSTTHGFRNTFTDWNGDNGYFDKDLTDKALAHIERDKTRRAYERSDLLERRFPLMEKWGQFSKGISAN